jgi:hypothetical protein
MELCLMRIALMLFFLVVVELALYVGLVMAARIDAFSNPPRWPWLRDPVCFTAILLLPAICVVAIAVWVRFRVEPKLDSQQRGFEVIAPGSRDKFGSP